MKTRYLILFFAISFSVFAQKSDSTGTIYFYNDLTEFKQNKSETLIFGNVKIKNSVCGLFENCPFLKVENKKDLKPYMENAAFITFSKTSFVNVGKIQQNDFFDGYWVPVDTVGRFLFYTYAMTNGRGTSKAMSIYDCKYQTDNDVSKKYMKELLARKPQLYNKFLDDGSWKSNIMQYLTEFTKHKDF